MGFCLLLYLFMIFLVFVVCQIADFCILYMLVWEKLQEGTLDPKAVNDENCASNANDGNNNSWYSLSLSFIFFSYLWVMFSLKRTRTDRDSTKTYMHASSYHRCIKFFKVFPESKEICPYMEEGCFSLLMKRFLYDICLYIYQCKFLFLLSGHEEGN